MNATHKQQVIAAIHDESGLIETLACYRELASYIACADTIDAASLSVLLETVNKQFETAVFALNRATKRLK